MRRDHHLLCYRLDSADRYAIWYSGDGDNPDGVIVDDAGRIVNFVDAAQGQRYANERGLALLSEAPLWHDLDVVGQWLEKPRKRTVDCRAFLAAWNLFGDVAQSVQVCFDCDRSRTAKIYAKLFWGNNLPAITPADKLYEPIWTKSEVGIIQNVLGNGLSLFRRHLAD